MEESFGHIPNNTQYLSARTMYWDITIVFTLFTRLMKENDQEKAQAICSQSYENPQHTLLEKFPLFDYFLQIFCSQDREKTCSL